MLQSIKINRPPPSTDVLLLIKVIKRGKSPGEGMFMGNVLGRSKWPLITLNWFYSTETGPSYWKNTYPTCGGSSQSPINVELRNIHYKRDMPPIFFEGYDTIPENVSYTLLNNGHTGQSLINYAPQRISFQDCNCNQALTHRYSAIQRRSRSKSRVYSYRRRSCNTEQKNKKERITTGRKRGDKENRGRKEKGKRQNEREDKFKDQTNGISY